MPAAIMEGISSSTVTERNPFFTPIQAIVCTGFAVRVDLGTAILQ